MPTVMLIDGHLADLEYDPDDDTFQAQVKLLDGGLYFAGRDPDELRCHFPETLEAHRDAIADASVDRR